MEPILNAYILRNPSDGELYLQRAFERGIRSDTQGAIADLEVAISLGNVNAKIHFGQVLVNGFEGIARDQERGLALLREAADSGDAYGKHTLNQVVNQLGLGGRGTGPAPGPSRGDEAHAAGQDDMGHPECEVLLGPRSTD